MKAIKKFIIGSNYFFSEYSDYKSKDIDILYIMDRLFDNKRSFNTKIKNKDIFLYPNFTKEEFISLDLNSNVPMRLGKYLIPKFAKYINLTIEDLKKLKVLVDNLDENHLYEKIIYESYIENSDFYLTKEQKNKAYVLYIKTKI